MDKTTPHCHAESFAAFVERNRKETAEAESRENTDDGDDLDDAWAQHDEERTTAQAAGKGVDSSADWFDDISGVSESAPEAESPDEPAKQDEPTPEPEQQSAAEEAARTDSQTDRRSNRRRLTERCRGYKVNDALANCREISDKVRCTLAIINGLMSNLGYCYGSIDQLSIYMHMSVRGAHNLLDKLWRLGFIVHIGMSGRNIKRVVRPDLSNNPQRTQRLIDEYNREGQ